MLSAQIKIIQQFLLSKSCDQADCIVHKSAVRILYVSNRLVFFQKNKIKTKPQMDEHETGHGFKRWEKKII